MYRHILLATLKNHAYMILPESVGWYEKVGDHEVYREGGSWNSFSIHFVISGTGYVEIDQQSYTLTAGDAFLYFPLQEQKYYSSKEDPWSLRWVHFYGSTLQLFFSETGIGRFILWKTMDMDQLITIHQQLLQEAEEHSMLQLASLSTLTYSLVTTFINSTIPRNAQKKDDRIPSLLPKMQQEASLPFDLNYWADQIGVSVFYFCKLFKQATQLTPVAFITLCRLQRSKQLLLENRQLTVKEIANEVGYTNISYFNRVFRENEGMTPTSYRKMYY